MRLVAVLWFIIALASCNSTSEEQRQADDLKARVADTLRDPESARFSNLKLHQGSLCGEVNGKNGFGGYAGNENFSVIANIVQTRNEIERIDGLAGNPKVFDGRSVTEEFDEKWQGCQRSGKPVK